MNRVVRLIRSAKVALVVWLLGGIALGWELLAGAPDPLSGARRLFVGAAVWFLLLVLVLGMQRAMRATLRSEDASRVLASRYRRTGRGVERLQSEMKEQRVALVAVAKALGGQNRALESHRVLSIRHVNRIAALLEDRFAALEPHAGQDPSPAAPEPADESAKVTGDSSAGAEA